MALPKSHSLSSLMGLALDGRQVDGVLVQRANGTFKVTRTFRMSLSLDPLTNDPELVGREIRNHLNEAGIRERRCAVSLPLSWVLTMSCKLPELPEADVPGFLQMEAEQGFPHAPQDLALAVSRFRAPGDGQYASLIAVPRDHVLVLLKALQAARLEPVSFSLGIAALDHHREAESCGALTLAVGETGVGLLVSSPGGVAGLRALEGALETEGAERRPDVDLIAREIRITLGQLPAELRDAMNRIRMYGPQDLTLPLLDRITPLARGMGLSVELGTPPAGLGSDDAATMPGGVSLALALALARLRGLPEFEFLPPKVNAWTRIITRLHSRRILAAGAAAGGVLLLAGGALGWQQWQLSGLESAWRAAQPKVEALDGLQQQTRRFRAWFDESLPSLRIFKALTEAFPEDGAAWARTLEVRDLSEVTCSGQARDPQAWLALLERLGKIPQATQLKVVQVTGKSPLKFTFQFRWSDGVRHEN